MACLPRQHVIEDYMYLQRTEKIFYLEAILIEVINRQVTMSHRQIYVTAVSYLPAVCRCKS